MARARSLGAEPRFPRAAARRRWRSRPSPSHRPPLPPRRRVYASFPPLGVASKKAVLQRNDNECAKISTRLPPARGLRAGVGRFPGTRLRRGDRTRVRGFRSYRIAPSYRSGATFFQSRNSKGGSKNFGQRTYLNSMTFGGNQAVLDVSEGGIKSPVTRRNARFRPAKQVIEGPIFGLF